MAGEKSGCFTWCVRLKEACNERWARFINRLRRRFYARRGQRVDPASVLNETGTKDMVLSKTPRKSNIVIPDILAGNSVTVEPLSVGCATEKDFDKQVEEYVARIIQTAADTLMSEAQLLSNTRIITVNTEDNVSLTSSVISQIADIAVTDSLSNIAMESDINQSAINLNKLRRIEELMDNYGTVADDKDDASGVPSGKV
ncbi:uncharacterized protein LOC123536999 [Mercenaria mercenaria]|uniref:uncharacterized protein LOC123536999 n=1 Tax=Mercenaria mercenaria TaxID=6596 RepID=UPI00234EAD07|nr:uncharacterized protein LOC123536999 [Mercenaria mercenaria]